MARSVGLIPRLSPTSPIFINSEPNFSVQTPKSGSSLHRAMVQAVFNPVQIHLGRQNGHPAQPPAQESGETEKIGPSHRRRTIT